MTGGGNGTEGPVEGTTSPPSRDEQRAKSIGSTSPATSSAVASPQHENNSGNKNEAPPPGKTTGWPAGCLALVTTFDCVGTYVGCSTGGTGTFAGNPADWGGIMDFTNGTGDLALLLGIRLVSILLLAFPVMTLLKQRQLASFRAEEEKKKKKPIRDNREDERAPLLGGQDGSINADGEATVGKDEVAVIETGFVEKTTRYRPPPGFERFRHRHAVRSRNNRTANLGLTLLFFILTACNGVVSIKCLHFAFGWRPGQEVLIALTVLWTNLEMYLLRMLLQRTINVPDEQIKALHPHPLVFNADVAVTKCDVCNVRINKECFDCALCDYNICLECFKKKTRAHGENIMTRTDKGVAGPNEQKEFSAATYVLRGLKLLQPFWQIVITALVCLIGAQVLQITLPNFQGKVIDSIVKHDESEFWHYIRLFIALSMGSLLLRGVRAFCTMLAIRNVSFRTRMRLFESILVRDIAFFDGATTGSLTARMTTDMQAMVSPLNTLITSVLSNGILLIGALVMCLIVSWRLAMISMTIVGPIIFMTGVYARWSRKLNRRVFDSLAEANNTATQAFNNVRTVRAFSTERSEITKFTTHITDALNRTIRDALAMAGVTVSTSMMELGANAIILVFGGLLVINREDFTVGNLVTFQLYINMMNSAYQGLDNVVNSFTRSAGAAERVLAMLDGKPDIDVTNGERPEALEGDMELRNVSFFYTMRPNKTVLDGVDIHFKRDSVTALVGKSGSGKSTVMHLLLRFYDPKSGSITVDGRDMCDISLEWLHHQMAVVAQDTQLFSSSIEENICYGLDSVTRAEMIAASKLANAHEFIDSFPDGYQTTVGERGVRLSGGQRQRIAIARAFLRRPRILLLDEATSALDAESESQVQAALDKLIGDLHNSCTIVIVAHRLSTVVKADNIVVLQDGKKVEEGNHATLVEKKGAYWNLVSRQLESAREQAAADAQNLSIEA